MVEYIGKKVREEKGYTLRSLAKKSTLAQSTISKYENGHNLPNLLQLGILANTLGVDIMDLIHYTPD